MKPPSSAHVDEDTVTTAAHSPLVGPAQLWSQPVNAGIW